MVVRGASPGERALLVGRKHVAGIGRLLIGGAAFPTDGAQRRERVMRLLDQRQVGGTVPAPAAVWTRGETYRSSSGVRVRSPARSRRAAFGFSDGGSDSASWRTCASSTRRSTMTSIRLHPFADSPRVLIGRDFLRCGVEDRDCHADISCACCASVLSIKLATARVRQGDGRGQVLGAVVTKGRRGAVHHRLTEPDGLPAADLIVHGLA